MDKQATIQVRDVMKRTLNKVKGIDTVQAALNKMVDLESRILIVDKRNQDDEYGIVLFADIAKQVIAKDRSPERVNIYEIMSKPVISVREDMDIRYCSRLFSRFGLNIAPVSDRSGELIGTVSYRDIVLKSLLKEQS
jgi:CBS domain-containing protein